MRNSGKVYLLGRQVLSLLIRHPFYKEHMTNPWMWLQALKKRPEHFAGFFQHVLSASLEYPKASIREQTALLVFLNHCFNSMEVDLIREQVKRLVSLSMWISLQEVCIFALRTLTPIYFLWLCGVVNFFKKIPKLLITHCKIMLWLKVSQTKAVSHGYW